MTSKYASFAEHIGSYDGKLPVLAAGALAGTQAQPGAVLAAHAPELPGAMGPRPPIRKSGSGCSTRS